MASKAKTIQSIKDLTPDRNNANRHTQRGMGLMEQSIQECGFGDSVTVDRHGNVISGNGRVETLGNIDMTDAIVVQSDGTKPVIHQRTDLDLTKDAKAKRLAILQNRVGQVNLDWDAEALAGLAEEGVELNDLWSEDELSALLGDALSDDNEGESTTEKVVPEQFMVVVQCEDEADQVALLERLTKEGLKCRALLS